MRILTLKERRRLIRIMCYLLEVDGMWSSVYSPRMTQAEYHDLTILGFKIQGDGGMGAVAGRGPTLYSSMDKEHNATLLKALQAPGGALDL